MCVKAPGVGLRMRLGLQTELQQMADMHSSFS